LYRSYRMYQDYSPGGRFAPTVQRGHGDPRFLLKLAAWMLIIAVPVWHFEVQMCSWILQVFGFSLLHVVWHLGSSTGMYLLMSAFLLHRMRVLGNHTRIRWLGDFFPIVEVERVPQSRHTADRRSPVRRAKAEV
jgi:hypothetical protein